MRKAILAIVLIATIAASSTSLVFATNLFDRKDVAATASGDNINITHHSASVNGIVLRYVIAGEGDPVVLLHGFPETSYAWRHVMPILAQNYTVIAPDIRGFGDSSKPAIGYGGKTAAEDIYQLISQLGYDEIFLVGHDIGAQVAYSYAAAHPDGVKKLVIMDYIFPGFYPEGIDRALW